MPEQKQKRKKSMMRALKWLLVLVAVGIVALVVWIEVVPMVFTNSVAVYDSYTTETGDISTQKSFSAALSVKKSETFTSTQVCRVKEIYVQSGDEVKDGDPLILLSTGEEFYASFDGVVNEIRVAVGDWIRPRFTVVQICDLQHLEVSMTVDEYDIEKLTLGETCTVKVISLGVDYDTVISHINRVSASTGTVGTYNVTCDLTVPENVLPGMQATVTLPSDSVTGVTTLDLAALSFNDSGEPYVLLKQADGTYTEQLVETGLSNGMKVQITSGLTTGQTVYIKTGTESVQSPITLESLYKMIVGEKVVINGNSSRGSGGWGQFSQDGTTQGMTVPSGEALTTGQTDRTQTGATGQTTSTDTSASTQPTAMPNLPNMSGQTTQATTDNTSGTSVTQSTASATDAEATTIPDRTQFGGSVPQVADGQTSSQTASSASPDGAAATESPTTN